jgi:molybdopterin-binding protein
VHATCFPAMSVAANKGATTAHVNIELASGAAMLSSIMNDAVDDLDVKVGDSVQAVIKSSDVIIGK